MLIPLRSSWLLWLLSQRGYTAKSRFVFTGKSNTLFFFLLKQRALFHPFVSFLRNVSLGMCKCEKSDWKNLHKGQWSFAMSPYDTQYIDLKFSGQSSGSVTISVTEGSSLFPLSLAANFFTFWLCYFFLCRFSGMAYSLSCGWTGRDLGSTSCQQLASVLLHQLYGCWCFPRRSYHYFPGNCGFFVLFSDQW